MRTRQATTPRPLTKQQDEQRLRGLRALARLIARAHLASRAAGTAGDGDEPYREEDGHAG